MDAKHTPAAASLAVLGPGTAAGAPPLIVQAAVLHLTGPLITGGPFTYWVAPDTAIAEVPVRYWPQLRLTPPLPEVAGRVLLALGSRILVVHDQAQLDVLRRHLPDWQPAEVSFTGALAQRWWPRLAGDGRDPLTAPATDGRQSRVGPVAEAHAAAVVVLAALNTTGQLVPQPFRLTGARGPGWWAGRWRDPGCGHRRDRPASRCRLPARGGGQAWKVTGAWGER